MSRRHLHTGSPLAALTDDQAAELFERLRRGTLADGKKLCAEKFAVQTSPAALSRWFGHESACGARLMIARAKAGADAFDRAVDAIPARAELASVKALYWDAVTRRDFGSIDRLGKRLLELRADARREALAERTLAAERECDRLRAELEKAKSATVADLPKKTDEEREAAAREVFGLN